MFAGSKQASPRPEFSQSTIVSDPPLPRRKFARLASVERAWRGGGRSSGMRRLARSTTRSPSPSSNSRSRLRVLGDLGEVDPENGRREAQVRASANLGVRVDDRPPRWRVARRSLFERLALDPLAEEDVETIDPHDSLRCRSAAEPRLGEDAQGGVLPRGAFALVDLAHLRRQHV